MPDVVVPVGARTGNPPHTTLVCLGPHACGTWPRCSETEDRPGAIWAGAGRVGDVVRSDQSAAVVASTTSEMARASTTAVGPRCP
jgi:hypothetical protein